jgi:predicted metal-dependent hydrolase
MNKYRIGLMDKNWKRFERRVAKRSGGRRISVADRETDLDVEHPYLGIECKYREKLSKYLKDWYKQAEEGSKNLQIPVVAIGEKNSSRIYALLDFDDLIMLLVHAVDDSDEALPTNYGGTD